MATVRDGRQAVLLIVDVQVGVMAEAWNAEAVVQRIAGLLDRARAQGVPVLWVQHGDAELVRGSPAWQWVPGLQPAEGEPRFDKQYNSAFEQTSLDATLARLQASHIVLAGALSSWCIRATAYAALERGYDLSLVSDGHSTGDMPMGGGRTLAAADIVQELNNVMTWIAYPGRRSTAVAAAAVDFGRPPGRD